MVLLKQGRGHSLPGGCFAWHWLGSFSSVDMVDWFQELLREQEQKVEV